MYQRTSMISQPASLQDVRFVDYIFLLFGLCLNFNSVARMSRMTQGESRDHWGSIWTLLEYPWACVCWSDCQRNAQIITTLISFFLATGFEQKQRNGGSFFLSVHIKHFRSTSPAVFMWSPNIGLCRCQSPSASCVHPWPSRTMGRSMPGPMVAALLTTIAAWRRRMGLLYRQYEKSKL